MNDAAAPGDDDDHYRNEVLHSDVDDKKRSPDDYDYDDDDQIIKNPLFKDHHPFKEPLQKFSQKINNDFQSSPISSSSLPSSSSSSSQSSQILLIMYDSLCGLSSPTFPNYFNSTWKDCLPDCAVPVALSLTKGFSALAYSPPSQTGRRQINARGATAAPYQQQQQQPRSKQPNAAVYTTGPTPRKLASGLETLSVVPETLSSGATGSIKHLILPNFSAASLKGSETYSSSSSNQAMIDSVCKFLL